MSFQNNRAFLSPAQTLTLAKSTPEDTSHIIVVNPAVGETVAVFERGFDDIGAIRMNFDGEVVGELSPAEVDELVLSFNAVIAAETAA